MFSSESLSLPDEQAIAEFCGRCDYSQERHATCHWEANARECRDVGIPLFQATMQHVRAALGYCEWARQNGVEGVISENGFAPLFLQTEGYVLPAIRALLTSQLPKYSMSTELVEQESWDNCLRRISAVYIMHSISEQFYNELKKGDGTIYNGITVTAPRNGQLSHILRRLGRSHICISITEKDYSKIMEEHQAVEAYRRKMSDA